MNAQQAETTNAIIRATQAIGLSIAQVRALYVLAGGTKLAIAEVAPDVAVAVSDLLLLTVFSAARLARASDAEVEQITAEMLELTEPMKKKQAAPNA